MKAKRKTNGHSKPEDFLLPEIPAVEEAELPSGLAVKLRPPVHLEFWVHAGKLPAKLESAMRGDVLGESTAEELIDWSYRMISALIVEPRFSPEPGEGEFHPRRLRPEDRAWLMAYYNRHMGGGGGGLEKFRDGEPGADAGAGARREGVRSASQPDPEGKR